MSKKKFNPRQRHKELRTPENRQAFLDIISTGGTWKDVVDELGFHSRAWRLWLQQSEDFYAEYQQARELATDWATDQLHELAAGVFEVEVYPDYMTGPDGEVLTDDEDKPVPHPKAGEVLPQYKDHSQKVRAATDALFKSAQLRNAKKYGQLVKLADANGEPLTVNRVSYLDLPDEHQEKPRALEATDVPYNEVKDDGQPTNE